VASSLPVCGFVRTFDLCLIDLIANRSSTIQQDCGLETLIFIHVWKRGKQHPGRRERTYSPGLLLVMA